MERDEWECGRMKSNREIEDNEMDKKERKEKEKREQQHLAKLGKDREWIRKGIE